MASSFVPLRSRSRGSLLRGTAPPAELAARAAALGHEALALTDRGGLYAAIPFVQAAREAGLTPLLGAELGDGPEGKAAGREGDGPACLVALAADRAGYAALCRLVTARHASDAPPLEESCAAAGPGLHLVALARGVAERLVARRRRAQEEADALAEAALASLWIGVSQVGPGGARARRAEAAAAALGIEAVALGEVDALSRRGAPDAALLAAVRANRRWRPEPAAPPALLAAPDAMAQPFARHPALLAANRRLAAACRVDIALGVPRFPSPRLAPGENAYARLYRLCQAGLARRYGAAPRAAVRRLGEELDCIDRLGFTPYFLLVAEIVEFARARGIPSVGRGSGASSLVAYLLGITNVDPVRYRLAFERFLHPERRDCPDLDIDLCWQQRDEVIAHVYRTYGAERVAMISTHCTLGPRGALREAARAVGLPPARVDALSRLVPREAEGSLAAALAASPRARGLDLAAEPMATVLRLAERLAGLADHLGIHPGGLVIADTALTDYTPLETATKGIVVSQYEMHAVEAVGLVKMDLLGNRALTEIGDARDLVAAATGERPSLDPPPDGDRETARLVAAGDTVGVFQLESPGMRQLLGMLRARSLDETIAAVALIRPGPAGSGMKETFVRRARGLERPRYLHPRLEPILAANHGLLLYEEDVMQAAAALADWTLAEGDLFRRAVGGARTAEERAALGRAFTGRLVARGVDAATAEAAWQDLARFGAYAFCRAHAAGYGVLAYQAAYLKAHWPAAFAVSLLAHHAGMYPTWVLVADAQRRGVRFRLPCVERSQAAARLDDGADPVRGPVRLGLSRVRGLGERTLSRLLAARQTDGPFRSLADFLGRVRPALAEVLALVDAGAFDVLGGTRAAWKLEATATHARYRAAEDEGAFRVREAPLATAALREFDAPTLRRLEWEALGVGVLAHPCEVAARDLAPPGEGPWGVEERRRARRALGLVPLGEAPAEVGCRIEVAGMAAATRRVRTTRGEVMLFLTLDDGTGLLECTLFPEAYRRLAHRLRGAGPFRVAGRVATQLGAVTLEVEELACWRSRGQLARPAPVASAASGAKGVRQGGPGAKRQAAGPSKGRTTRAEETVP
jgi:DNA-directed DNA polymerase III PolC